jgi:hypothetical protein
LLNSIRESKNVTPDSHRSRPGSSHRKPQASPTSLSSRYRRDLQARSNASTKSIGPRNQVIELDDSDSESGSISIPYRQPTQPVGVDDDEDEVVVIEGSPSKAAKDKDLTEADEDLKYLVEKARERQQQSLLLKSQTSQAFTQQNHSDGDFGIDDDFFRIGGSKVPQDPAVQIFVTSQIEGAKALLAKLRLSQRLGGVREAWCHKQPQPLTPEEKDAVFLTWKGKRLYDATTCGALGIKFDEEGSIATGIEGIDEEGRVHLEIWTQELFDAYQEEMAKLKAREAGQLVEEEPKAVVVPVRLILKSRDLGESKFKAKPTTLVAKMIQHFRSDKAIPDDKDVSLHYDGEILDPEKTIEEAELEDLDSLEVHVR